MKRTYHTIAYLAVHHFPQDSLFSKLLDHAADEGGRSLNRRRAALAAFMSQWDNGHIYGASDASLAPWGTDNARSTHTIEGVTYILVTNHQVGYASLHIAAPTARRAAS